MGAMLRAHAGARRWGPSAVGSTVTHDPAPIPHEVWARRRSIGATSEYKVMKMSIWGQTVLLVSIAYTVLALSRDVSVIIASRVRMAVMASEGLKSRFAEGVAHRALK